MQEQKNIELPNSEHNLEVTPLTQSFDGGVDPSRFQLLLSNKKNYLRKYQKQWSPAQRLELEKGIRAVTFRSDR